jgi:hypothetical protein
MENFIGAMHAVDIAASALMALFDVVLLALFLRAYLRSRRGFFLVLAVGSLALAVANILTGSIYVYAATRLRVIPIAIVEATYVLQIMCVICGGILSFIGTVLLIRFALLSYGAVRA